MIQCPNCAKDIADDSAHCGFCGAKIETGAGKKTMMGFAALTGDRLKEAAEEARRAREEAEAQSTEPASSAESASKPSAALPRRPSQTRLPDDGRPKLPGITRPTPQAGTPAPPDLNKLSIGGGGGTDDDSPTAVMAAVPGQAPSTVDEVAVDGPDFAADTNPEPPPVGSAPKTVPVAPATEDTLPERGALGSDGPSEFGGGHVVDGPSEFGSGSNIVLPENALPEKKKNPVVFVVGGIAVLMFLCCALSLAYSFLLPILL